MLRNQYVICTLIRLCKKRVILLDDGAADFIERLRVRNFGGTLKPILK